MSAIAGADLAELIAINAIIMAVGAFRLALHIGSRGLGCGLLLTVTTPDMSSAD